MEFLKRKIVFFMLALWFQCQFLHRLTRQHWKLHFRKVTLHEKNGDFSAAMDEMKKVMDESSYEINLRLGWLNYNAGLFDESVIFYSAAQKLKPYSEEARFGLILPKAAQGKWNEVIELVQ